MVVVVILDLGESGCWGLNEEDQQGETEEEDEVVEGLAAERLRGWCWPSLSSWYG